MLQDGDKAPEFALPTDGGDRFELSKARPAVVYFYPKDDTSGCTNEAKDYSRLQPEFRKAGVVVVGISPDSVDSHRKFRAKHGLSIALAADADRHVAKAYGVWVEKSMYGRTYMGVERSTFLIDAQGRIARSWRKVKVAGHADDVLAAAKTMTSTRRRSK
jgi:thioredoxin-dependent peroxiredoxin